MTKNASPFLVSVEHSARSKQRWTWRMRSTRNGRQVGWAGEFSANRAHAVRMAKKLFAVFAIQIVSSLAFAASASAQATTLVWDAYPDVSSADMISLYRYLVTIDGTPTPLSPSCSTGVCTAALPTFAAGTTHTITLRVACAATPTVFGTPTATISWTVGGAVPPPISTSPPPNPCASTTPAPRPTPSPIGTMVPASATFVDQQGRTWTRNAQTGQLLVDGQPASGGSAQEMLLWSDGVYAHTDNRAVNGIDYWFRWSDAVKDWIRVAGDPRVTAPPTPTRTPNTFAVAPKTCGLTDSKPDERTGWGVQFKVDGVNVGGRDTTSPFSRDTPYVPGPHVYEAVWTKTGVASVTRTIKMTGCQP